MIVVRALYGLRSSDAAFRALLAEVLYDMGCVPIKADPNIYLRPAIKSNEFNTLSMCCAMWMMYYASVIIP